MSATVSPVGILLKEWRGLRRMSQLDLALKASVSARHVSFVETGRARPSREMVLHLASALDVPLRDRNLLLTAAGFAPVFPQRGLDAEEMAPVRRALDRILARQEPHPAVVMDRHWNVLEANDAASALFSRFVDLAALPPPPNILRLMFDPEGVRPYVANWDEVATGLLGRAERESVCGVPDEGLRGLLQELRRFPGVPSATALVRSMGSSLPVIPVRFRKGEFTADYFSAITTLGTPQDVTLQEIRIESFFPLS